MAKQLVAGRGIYDVNGDLVTPGTVLSGQVAYGLLQGGKWSIWEFRYTKDSGETAIQGYVSTFYKDPLSGDFDPYSYDLIDIDSSTKEGADAYFKRSTSTGKTGSHQGARVMVACSGMDGLSKIFFETVGVAWASAVGTITVNHINDRSGI